METCFLWGPQRYTAALGGVTLLLLALYAEVVKGHTHCGTMIMYTANNVKTVI